MIFIRAFCIPICLVIFLLTTLQGSHSRKALQCQRHFLIVPGAFDDAYNSVSLKKIHKKAVRIFPSLRTNFFLFFFNFL